ncbi:hypothetical protein LD125_00252 [Mesoplasma sp. JKS002658]|uniref:transcription termination factor NusA n=1 Tax=Mesoplasma whartonense TaxID=2878854 RepID=UPI002022A894|nr:MULTISPECIES: transcription termination factor NusA [unclassified Mesoplasma]MCL8211242.1 hypothetical protein [Mesoplasma sp. JKS002664]MCL8211903.1 hypothetical protein [Mesoplasma sp. JKS002662]MCL8213992.1 hypothetical protein [Mesoplasma sp. JKS002658]MCL8214580.1 hypothetical protein [Mesoplasma sp. JKS002663]MCL8215311.1 hypothetical protein [Mesoplasma sp. JKS002659]
MENYANILEAINQIANEKSIDENEIITAIKEGFQKAYERFFDTEALTEVDLDDQTGSIKMYLLLKVVDQVQDDLDDWLEISLDDARQEFGDKVKEGDIIHRQIPFEKEFSRLAIHQVRQIIQQKIKGAERSRLYDKFADKNHQLLTGKIVGTNDRGDGYLIEVDDATTSLWNKKLIPGDHFEIGDLVSFYVDEVQRENRFSPISISRTAPGFLRRILEREVPEVAEEIIDIKGISREPGIRAKVAVQSLDPNVEPIGALVGVHGSRISKISELLNGEKIDIVLWDEDLNTFIMSAMAPVRVVSVDVDLENNEADIIVPNEQLSLAIGRGGVAARLVANLLKMKINIISVKQAQEIGIENKWNGNISPDELASKEFIDSTMRRRKGPKNNNLRTSQPRFRDGQNYQKSVVQTNDDILKELEQELERFQAEIADEEGNQTISQTSEHSSILEKNDESDLDEISKNLQALDEVISGDDSDDDDEGDEYDSYYD